MSAMTEAEAKTRWCPFVRSSVVGANDAGKLMVISNRDAAQLVPDSDPNAFTHNCIGGACMAWRWHGIQNKHLSVIATAEAKKAARDQMYEIDEIPLGFCGLAGKP